jgi:hypothetical protein
VLISFFEKFLDFLVQIDTPDHDISRIIELLPIQDGVKLHSNAVLSSTVPHPLRFTGAYILSPIS